MRGVIASLSDDEIATLFGDVTPGEPVALAVSGGGDSMALLALARQWGGGALTVLTVDHGLRAESAGEAAQVARVCAEAGIHHETLQWNADGQGNLSDRARVGRYTLMAQACRERGIRSLLTGHTLDDQAETVLMRLGRGSGVDGLAGIRRVSDLWGVRVVRPLLAVSRERLRGALREAGLGWVDDPSNEDRDRMRIKARDALAGLGIDAARLSQTAERMADAQAVLDGQATALAEDACIVSPLGYVTCHAGRLVAAPRDTGLRLLARILCGVSGQVYRPRFASLETLLREIGDPGFGGRTLHGCRIDPSKLGIVVQREPSACAAPARVTSSRVFWDGRFEIDVPEAMVGDPDLSVGATGEAGLRLLKASKSPVSHGWAASPHPARLAAPALRRGDELLAIPLADHAADAVVRECKVRSAITIGTVQVDPDAGPFI